MQQRQLGRSGLEVSALGLGCMAISDFYGACDQREAMADIHRAIELGVNFLDTADIYGLGRNEEPVGRAILDRRDRVLICSRFGNVRRPTDASLASMGAPIMFAQPVR
jgi:aryl-alcohol dehydrogenase-like predicted oxidoreductase